MKSKRGTKGQGIGGHHRAYRGLTDDWLTPLYVVQAVGPFDLDPCAGPMPRPWNTALNHIAPPEDGLKALWHGRVWLNPPYGQQTGLWLSRLADHGNGIALTFARTETEMFHEQVWKRADGLLFLRGRLFFHRPDGSRAKHNCGGPSVLIAYGLLNAERLRNSGLDGKYVDNMR